MKKLIIVLFLFLSQITNISAQVVSTGKDSVFINNMPKQEVKQYKPPKSLSINHVTQSEDTMELLVGGGKYYALIIGINNYDDPSIYKLDRPIIDAEKFYTTITTKYTFAADNVKLLRNATKAEIEDALEHFEKIVQPIDNFLIFYAGHGFMDKASDIGFWLPSDASNSSKVAWFRNSTLRDYLRTIKSKHTLLISDACFGGSIFKSRGGFKDASIAINKLYELPSRKAMTSGNLEEVPDQSVFMKYMIERLQNNFEKYLTSEQLFNKFRMAVIGNSRTVPEYGVIQDVGDEGGDFIFILR